MIFLEICLVDENVVEEIRKKESENVTNSFDLHMRELKSLRKMRGSAIEWIKKEGISTKSVQSLKSYCTALGLLQLKPEQLVSVQAQQSILASVEPTVVELEKYSENDRIDPADMDEASSACVNVLGKLSQVLDFVAKYQQPTNPSLLTTTTEASIDYDDQWSQATTKSPETVQMLGTIRSLQESIMNLVLLRKGLKESRSVIGGSSSKMSLAADLVENLDNGLILLLIFILFILRSFQPNLRVEPMMIVVRSNWEMPSNFSDHRLESRWFDRESTSMTRTCSITQRSS